MFKKIKHVHFVGIGGSGMSGIAEVLLKLGYRVTGSDAGKSAVTKRLKELGASVFFGHAARNVEGADVVVTSTAISKSNLEVKAAHKAGIPVIPRIEMLAELARLKYTIAVAGTHGKTTTTSLVAQILKHADLDPTVIVGGRLKAVGTGGVLGSGNYLVAEADESDGSFLKLSPTIGIVTNIDDDHLDYYKTMKNLEDAFVQFANHIPFYGATYVCGEDPGVKRVLPKLTRRCLTYGFGKNFDLQTSNIVLDEGGCHFDAYYKKKRLGRVSLPLSGKHNILNALAAIAVGLHLDLPFEKISEALACFEGVGRRIEFKGEVNGVTVVDDYGHHPTEIKATLAAVRARWTKRRLVVLFQPHRYSRTQLLAKQFASALSAADQLFLMPIYPAGEKPIRGVTSASIAKYMSRKSRHPGMLLAGIHNKSVYKKVLSSSPRHVSGRGPGSHPDENLDPGQKHAGMTASGWNSPEDVLLKVLRPNDVLLTLGAGDVWKVGEALIKSTNSLAARLGADVPEISHRIKVEEPLSRHCTWGIGGPAEVFVELHALPELQEVVQWCRREYQPIFILGWGSNVLLPDKGLRGVVVRLRGDFESIKFNGSNVHVGAGVHLPRLAKACVEKGFAGVEALAGVPGTVGGALMTNAGTPRGVIGDVVQCVTVLNEDGSVSMLAKDRIELGYRHTNLGGKWIVSAELVLKPSENGSPIERLKWELDFRERTQPLGTKNVGSVFRNPPGDHAARLIEAVGLKGKTFGTMRFSPKHANFIENLGGGTAQKALELIHMAQAMVKEKFHVQLVPEVKIVQQPKPIGEI